MLDPGQPIGNYRIVQKLGEGGMGAVFEAVHQDIGRQVDTGAGQLRGAVGVHEVADMGQRGLADAVTPHLELGVGRFDRHPGCGRARAATRCGIECAQWPLLPRSGAATPVTNGDPLCSFKARRPPSADSGGTWSRSRNFYPTPRNVSPQAF